MKPKQCSAENCLLDSTTTPIITANVQIADMMFGFKAMCIHDLDQEIAATVLRFGGQVYE